MDVVYEIIQWLSCWNCGFFRQEQERKKQQELDKHLQKQREVEHEREEQRRKALEQREVGDHHVF